MFCTGCAPNFMPKSGGSFRCESKQKRYGFICQLSHHLFHSDLSFSLISWLENIASMDLNDSRNTCWSLSSSTCCALAYSSERRKKVRVFFNLLVNINTQEAPGQLCPALINVDEIRTKWTEKNYIQKLFKTSAIFLGKGTVCLYTCQTSHQKGPFLSACHS